MATRPRRGFLEDSRVALNPLTVDHVADYIWCVNDQRARRLARNVFPSSEEEFKQHIEESRHGPDRKKIEFEICHVADEQIIGLAMLQDLRWQDRIAALGLVIGNPAYWKKGYGTEAARLLVQYAFEEINLHKLTCSILRPNHASRRVAEKLGFELEATHAREAFVDGRYHDWLYYSLFREAYFREHAREHEYEHTHEPAREPAE